MEDQSQSHAHATDSNESEVHTPPKKIINLQAIKSTEKEPGELSKSRIIHLKDIKKDHTSPASHHYSRKVHTII